MPLLEKKHKALILPKNQKQINNWNNIKNLLSNWFKKIYLLIIKFWKLTYLVVARKIIKFIVKGLPSGYNRDLQEIKACIVDAYNISRNCIYIMTLAMDHVEADHGAIADRLQSDIVAADYAINKCVQNPELSFRDVYKESTENLQMTPIEAIKLRKSKGSPFNQ